MAGDVAEQLIEVLYAGEGIPTGCRANHARGLLVEGVFEPAEGAQRLSSTSFFDNPRSLVARFSSSSKNPSIAQDDQHADPRGCALSIGADDQALTLVGHSIDAFPARTPEEFLSFLKALSHVQRDPSGWERHLRDHAAARAFVGVDRPAPTSFASLTYHMLHPYRLAVRRGAPVLGRILLTGAMAGEKHEGGGADYLDEELRLRLARGPIELQLALHTNEGVERVDDISRPWPSCFEPVVLGRVILERVAADQEAQRSLVFDPSVLPKGLSFGGDPMLSARLAAYRLAFARRTGANTAPVGS